jgi:curli biogenesis system outer membrane secretion channel CsgG
MKRNLQKLLLLLIIFPLTIFAKESVAVNDFVGKNIDKETASIISDRVRSELINTGKYRVMDRSEMDVVLQEQGFQQSGACDDESCIVEVGQLLGVEKIFSGSIGRIGTSFFTLNIRIINVSTGEIEISDNFDYDKSLPDLVSKGIKESVKSLIKKVDNISGGTEEKLTVYSDDKVEKEQAEKEQVEKIKAEKDKAEIAKAKKAKDEKEKAEIEKAEIKKAEKAKKQQEKIEKESAKKADEKLITPEQRKAKRKKTWQWVRRVGFSSITVGTVTAGVLVNQNINSLYDDYNNLGPGDQEKMDALKDEIDSQKVLRNVLYGVGGASGVGLTISIPF